MTWPFRARSSTPLADLDADLRPAESAEKTPAKAEQARWNLDEGTEISEGRRVFKYLGGGTRYDVYLVWDDRLFSLVVAKVLRPDHAADAGAIEDLRREATMLGRLAHPIVVRGFGAVLEGTYPHVLIEFLEGPTLRQLIKRQGALPLEQVLPLALHIAAALHYMAVEQTVHLDVKPDNIVMGVPPRLIDLSIARSFDRAAKLRNPIGTDAYMPPEQCDPEAWAGRIGAPADVFGLGATLYHATTGELPFPRPRSARHSDELTVRFPQLVTEHEPFPSGVPESLQTLIEHMLAPNPAERPVAADVATALEPLVAGLGTKVQISPRGHLRDASVAKHRR